jgi:DNA processing protein
MMALALQMFSGIESDVTAPGSTAAADERWAWVALAQVPGIIGNARRYHDLLTLGAPADVFSMPRPVLAEHIGARAAEELTTFNWREAAAAQAARAARCAARLVLLPDADYPALLRPVDLPPPFLLIRGDLRREDALGIAIVGSRRGSPYGLRTAERLGADLGGRGVTVVSGLARGVDTAAHRGALDAGGRTLAVLGSGVDVVYPPENSPLARAVTEAGAVVSQFPMGTPPLPHHFPARNRLIAGMALGTVVVEAAARSGALITARLAAELGREVYAVPGNVSSDGSHGTNGLIRDGARLVEGWEDVVAEWPRELRDALRPVSGAGPSSSTAAAEVPAPGASALLALLGDEPVAIDTLVERSRLSSGQASAELIGLELRGLVRRVAGQRYIRS